MADDLFADIPAGDADLFGDIPVPKGKPGVRAALRDLMRERKALPKRSGLDLVSDRMANAFTLGLSNQSDALIGAGITGLQRLVPGGAQPTYTSRDMYDARRLLANAEQQRFAGRHPIVAGTSDVVGALGMPGGKQVGAYVVGKTAPALAAAGKSIPFATRAAQTARLAGTGGALTGITAANTARPGEEVSEGTRGALMGAALAPATELGLRVTPGMARATGRLAARAVGRGPSAEITSVEKLQKALRQAGVSPEAIIAAADRWTQMGGVDPALIDLVKEAGGSSEVLRLLSRSSAKAPARRLAEDYAEQTVGDVQAKATEQAQALPTGGETRTPSQIRADLDAERGVADAEAAQRAAEIARRGDTKSATVEQRGTKALDQIDQAEADRLAQIEATRVAETPEIPPAPRARESGAAAFADEINLKHDASQKVYKDAYAAAEVADPETAVVDDKEVRPLFEKLRIPRNFDTELPGVAAVTKYLAKKKGAIAPGDINDWPEGEAMGNAASLTMTDLQNMRQVLTHYASKYADEPGGALAARLKASLDGEIDRLAAENKITGDPEIVDKWKTAIAGYAQHQKDFGSGTAQKLTARNARGEREVASHQAGDVVFGAPNQLSMNKSLSEMGDTLDLVSPESVRALQEELYGRVKPADLAKLRETTGGKRLLPEDLSTEAIAAQEAAAAADAKAAGAGESATATAKALREAQAGATGARKTQVDLNAAARADRAAAQVTARRAPLDAQQQALEIGEGALKTPSEEFAPAVGGVDEINLPKVQSGAKQSVLDLIEGKAPGAKLSDLLKPRVGQNLGTAIGPQDVARMQARMRAIQGQAQTSQQLQGATDISALANTPLLETVTPGDIAYPTRGSADFGLKIWRALQGLHGEEYEAALRALTSKDPSTTTRLLEGLTKKYPSARKAVAPFLVRPSAQRGDPGAVDMLAEDYGVTP